MAITVNTYGVAFVRPVTVQVVAVVVVHRCAPATVHNERMTYRVLRLILSLLAYVLLRPQVTGRNNIPRNGAVILASNGNSRIYRAAYSMGTATTLSSMR